MSHLVQEMQHIWTFPSDVTKRALCLHCLLSHIQVTFWVMIVKFNTLIFPYYMGKSYEIWHFGCKVSQRAAYHFTKTDFFPLQTEALQLAQLKILEVIYSLAVLVNIEFSPSTEITTEVPVVCRGCTAVPILPHIQFSSWSNLIRKDQSMTKNTWLKLNLKMPGILLVAGRKAYGLGVPQDLADAKFSHSNTGI